MAVDSAGQHSWGSFGCSGPSDRYHNCLLSFVAVDWNLNGWCRRLSSGEFDISGTRKGGSLDKAVAETITVVQYYTLKKLLPRRGNYCRTCGAGFSVKIVE